MSIGWNALRDYDGSGDIVTDEVVIIDGNANAFPEFWPQDNSPSSVNLWTSEGKAGTQYSEKTSVNDVDASGDFYVNYGRGGRLTTHPDSAELSLFMSYNEIGTFDRVKYLNSIRNVVGSGDVYDKAGNVNLVTHANDDEIHSGGEGNVTAAASIRSNAIAIGDDGAKGIKDGVWSIGDDQVMHASGDLNMEDNDIINIKDIKPFDGEMNIQLPFAGTGYVKGTDPSIPGSFDDSDIDKFQDYLSAYWAMEQSGTDNRIDSVGSNDAAPSESLGTRAGIRALECAFAGSGYLRAPEASSLTPTKGVAISFWATFDLLEEDFNPFVKGDDIDFDLRCYYADAVDSLQFYIFESGGTQRSALTDGGAVVAGTRYHFVLMAVDGVVYLYQDSVQADTTDEFDGTFQHDSTTGVNIGSISGPVNGGVDEVGFWNDISFANATERQAFVDALYNSGKGTFFNVHSDVSRADWNVQDNLFVGQDSHVSGDSRVSGDSHISGDLRVAQTGYFGDDVEIVGLSGDIISSESVEMSIEELDASLNACNDSGFVSWDSGASGDTYTIAGAKFQIDRDLTVRIKGKQVSVSSGVQTNDMTPYKTNWIYAKDDGGIDAVSVFSHELFENYAPLFECHYDGTNFSVVKENHLYDFDTAASLEWHDVIGTVLTGTGANITRVATGTGASANDRKIKIVGSDILHDHGLATIVPDSAGAAVTLHQHYTDGSGRWMRDALQTEIVMKYNNAGTSTALASNKFGVGRLYISKDDIENAYPSFYSVMGDAEYANQLLADVAIGVGIPEATLELADLELCHLGYYTIKNTAAGGYITKLIIEKNTLKTNPTGAGATNSASLVSLDTTEFDGNLSSADSTVQLAMDTLDELAAGGDVTAANNLAQYKVVVGDDGSKGVKTSQVVIGDDGKVSGMSDLNCGAIQSSGDVTADGGATLLSSGDMIAPVSSVDNVIARFDGISGSKIQTTGITVDNSDNISGVGTIGCGAITSTGASQFGTLGIGIAPQAMQYGDGLTIFNASGAGINLISDGATLGRVIFSDSADSDEALGLIYVAKVGTTGGDMGFLTQTDSGALSASLLLGSTHTARFYGNVGIGEAPHASSVLVLTEAGANSNTVIFTNSNASTPYGVSVDFSAASPDDNTHYFLINQDSTAVRNYIYSDGDVWTSDAGTLTSDKRLKTNIKDATSKLDDVMKLKVRKFEWTKAFHPNKVGESKIGFIADEVGEIFPALISEHDIAPRLKENHVPVMRKAIKNVIGSPILVKAFQEYVTKTDKKIEALQAEVDALKSAKK